MQIDAHQHFWRVARGDYGWLTPQLGALYRDFGPDDLGPLLRACGISRTILVQAAPTIAETEFLLELAARTPFVAGVIGWVRRKKPILWSEPRPEYVPAHWSYEDAKAGLDAAGRLIDVSLAERRNLVMRNPASGSNYETSRTLVCAYQMILPGEKAPSHRHSSHALRVIIDAPKSRPPGFFDQPANVKI